MKGWKIAIIAIGDLVAMYGGLGLLFWVVSGGLNTSMAASHILPFSIIFLFWLGILFIFDQYDPIKGRPRMYNIRRIGYSLAASLLVGVVIFYVGGFGITPKANLLLMFVFYSILFISWRRFVFGLLRKRFLEKVVFLDENEHVEILKDVITNNPQLGYKLATGNEAPDIVISQTPFAHGRKIISLPNAYESLMAKIPVDIADTTLPYQIETKQDSIPSMLVKRIFDIVFSLSVLIGTSWLWPFIIIGIKIDDKGPIFYTQKRMGQNNTPFDFIKFRSMRTDAEKNGAVWADKNDSRVTKFGNFLRKSHLDEIPQMINILRGDMSVIGPRPERPEFVKELEEKIPLYKLRHVIKPGFTGWAQVKFRYARTVQESKEKFEYDLYYIKNRDISLDFGILLKTIQIFVTHL
jgi:lipopolysaccharide/colanic/teichoic acid biosynthesis glycosyltransferase